MAVDYLGVLGGFFQATYNCQHSRGGVCSTFGVGRQPNLGGADHIQKLSPRTSEMENQLGRSRFCRNLHDLCHLGRSLGPLFSYDLMFEKAHLRVRFPVGLYNLIRFWAILECLEDVFGFDFCAFCKVCNCLSGLDNTMICTC